MKILWSVCSGLLIGAEIKDRYCYDAYLNVKRRKKESRMYFSGELSGQLNLQMWWDDERELKRGR